MVLAIIVLFYVAAVIMYLAINRKSPAATSRTSWASSASLLETPVSTTAAQREITQPVTTSVEIPRRIESKTLLAPIERALYSALKQALADSHEVFIKIRIADLLPMQFSAQRETMTASQKINNEFFDFVVCRSDSLAVVTTVRLTDSAIEQPERDICDRLIRAVCKNANIPLIIIKSQAQYDIKQIKKLISLFDKY